MTTVQYIIIAACLLLAVFLIWKELQRPNRSRLIWRIIASVLAVTSLIFLAIPVYYNTSENIGTNEAILLTDGYNKDSLGAFRKQHANAVVYIKDQYEQQTSGDNNLHVFGYGLSADEWQAMPASNIVFHPSAIENGITAIGYNKQINSGDKLLVRGRFNNTSAKAITLTLSGFGVGLDSVIIKPRQSQVFELSTIPKFIGKAVYNLTAITGKDTVEQEALPLQVKAAKPLKILLLAAWPDFENKFLQNWLQENNYIVATRTTISKNKYSYSYVDTVAFSLSQLTPGVLEQFDVLIADGNALSSLSKQELFSIQEQVTNKGLGLVIKADSTAKPAVFFEGNCAIAPSSNHNKQTLSIQLPGNDSASTLPVENVSFIKVNNGTKALIADVKKNILACNALYGNGSIVFSTFTNSYYWALSGDKKSYELLWSSLISNAVKRTTINEQWYTYPIFPTVDKPVQLTAETVSEQPLRSTVDANFIAFAAQPYLPFEWKGIYWPTRQGWQTVVSSNSDTSWLYVYDKTAWKNIVALQQINDTYAYAALDKKQLPAELIGNTTGKKNIPLFYFFVVFMCCCIFLWIEKKLS